MKASWIAIVGCNNSYEGRNKGEQKRIWGLITNLTNRRLRAIMFFRAYRCYMSIESNEINFNSIYFTRSTKYSF